MFDLYNNKTNKYNNSNKIQLWKAVTAILKSIARTWRHLNTDASVDQVNWKRKDKPGVRGQGSSFGWNCKQFFAGMYIHSCTFYDKALIKSWSSDKHQVFMPKSK